MCDWNDKVLLRTTPRRLSFGEGEDKALSMVRKKLSTFQRVDLVPMRISVLVLFSFGKLKLNQNSILQER